MEVKDVPSAVVQTDAKSISDQASKATSADSTAVVKNVAVAEAAAVTVTLSVNPKASTNNDVRAKTNDTIETVNIAVEAADQIGKYLDGLQGIVEQAFDVSDVQKRFLSEEGTGLVAAIKQKANVETQSGIKPLSGDEIRLEIEETLGRSLDVILPDDARHAFGLGKIEFSTKESIINTRAIVAEAKRRFELLKEAVDKAVSSVRHTATEVDVAIQNTEASDINIRDVDVALKATSAARAAIREFPVEALGSFGEVDPVILDSRSR